MGQVSTNIKPQLLKVSEAAALLRVSKSTIHNWISTGSIPYIKLPSAEGKRTEYRLPLKGLIASLSANYDLAEGLDELISAGKTAGVNGDDILIASDAEPARLDE